MNSNLSSGMQPVHRFSVRAETFETSSGPTTGAAGMQDDVHIVLLEDDDGDAELVRLELQRAAISFSALQVKTKEEFLQALQQFSPDIVLADYTLPHFTALDALRILKDYDRSIPVILVTGSQSEDVAVECMKEGASDYILKQSLTRLPTAVINVLKAKAADREKNHAQQELKQSEERFRRLFASNPLPLFVFDVHSLKLVEVNTAAVAQYGYEREEFLGMWITDLWPTDDAPQVLRDIQTLSARSQLQGFWKHRWNDGQLRDVHVEMQTMNVSGRSAALLVAHDVTEQQRAEEELRASREQLRALSGHLQSIREEERKRIAREIHDELGQLLTALSMDTSWLRSKLAQRADPLTTALQLHTESMSKLIDTSIQCVRKIAAELRPRALDDLGLVPAIEWQVQEFQTRTAIHCEFISNTEDVNIDPERATAVFRILQESLTNIARHAGATRVRINLHADAERLSLQVHDNGKGIPQEAQTGKTSLGLLGMKERAVLLGGTLSIHGKQNKGTTVTVELPLPSSKR